MATPRKTAADKKRDAMPDPLAGEPAQAQLTVAPAANDEARKDIDTINTHLKEFDQVEAGLANLETKYDKVVFPVASTDGMEQARAAVKEIQTPRFKVEHVRVAAKAPVLKLGRSIDARAAAIKTRLMAIETPIVEQITAQEEVEANRKLELSRRLTEIRETPRLAIGKSILELEAIVEALETIDLSSFDEFREQAAKAQLDVTREINTMLTDKRAAEAAKKELAERQAKEAALETIRVRIRAMSDVLVTAAMARTSASLDRLIVQAKAVVVDATYGELQDEAAGARLLVIDKLNTMLEAKQASEKKAAEDAAAAAKAADAAAAATTTTQAPAVHYPHVESPVGVAVAAKAADTVSAQVRELPSVRGGGGGYWPARRPVEQARPVSMARLHEVQAPIETGPVATELGVMPERPTDDEIVDHLADHFDNHGMNVIEWLATMDLQAQRARFGQPALFEGAQA